MKHTPFSSALSAYQPFEHWDCMRNFLHQNRNQGEIYSAPNMRNVLVLGEFRSLCETTQCRSFGNSFFSEESSLVF